MILRRFLWIAAAWCAFGVFDATQTVALMQSEGMHHHWPLLFGVRIAAWLPWMVATPLILQLGRRFSLDAWRTPLTWLAHSAGIVVVGLVFSAWTALLDIVFDPYGDGVALAQFSRIFADTFLSAMLTAAVLYAFVVIMHYAIASRERVARKERDLARLAEQLSAARLEALRRQIEPHFLFNALNAVAGLIREQRNDAAVDVVVSLSDFLRSALQSSATQLSALSEELRIIERYLDIQKIRFGERLCVWVDVPAELREATVPTLILQPIVENAIKHGIAKRLRGGNIAITASATDGVLALRIYNDGPCLATDWARDGGIGFAHVRERLATLYGGRCGVTISDREPDGVEVRIALPLVAFAST